MNTAFRNLPSVDKIVSDERIKAFEGVYSHDLIVQVARQRLDRERLAVAAGKPATPAEDIAVSVLKELEAIQKPSLRRLINATGVVLHTNLGRAPLSRETTRAMQVASEGFSNLEFDVESGVRGSRQSHIEKLLCRLTGAEAAFVVNNNAAAVLLGLAALARRKEVIVSRGQAVEIGDSFRIPDVMRQSGAKLVEVGTTNCTYIRDYEQAITERTAALMRVHSSNFLVVGFTHSVSIEELAALGKERGLPVLDDLGSGAFLDTTAFGLSAEPMVQQSVTAGGGLVFFSADKLVGGPQAGIIVGKKELVEKLRRHPLARAVRIDKTRIAGLAATIVHYLKGEALEKVPVWRMISVPLSDIERRAHAWANGAANQTLVVEGESMIGGGSLPGGTLPTRLLAIRARTQKKGRSAVQELGRKLREHDPPIIGRISEDVLLLDPRTVLPEEDEAVVKALGELLGDSTS
jgi:L-seryl-tRNA(Ser) seleniumtransferase